MIGDIHGHTDTAAKALRGAGLIDADGSWAGGAATLWFLGDLTDRGEQGLEAIDLVMRLQREASDAGGRVHCLAGNHDLLFMGVKRFAPGPGAGELLDTWLMNGGSPEEVRGLSEEQADWMLSLPLVGKEGDTLLVHCDALFYAELGASVDEVNEHFSQLMATDSVEEWWRFTVRMFDRFQFAREPRGDGDGALTGFLRHFESARVVHGHTPIPAAARVGAAEVREPLVYAEGRCVNCDGGMYLGGAGFVYRLPDAGGSTIDA